MRECGDVVVRVCECGRYGSCESERKKDFKVGNRNHIFTSKTVFIKSFSLNNQVFT